VLAKFKLFWFFSVGLCIGKKPNVLECAMAFFTMRHNYFICITPSYLSLQIWVNRSDNLQTLFTSNVLIFFLQIIKRALYLIDTFCGKLCLNGCGFAAFLPNKLCSDFKISVIFRQIGTLLIWLLGSFIFKQGFNKHS